MKHSVRGSLHRSLQGIGTGFLSLGLLLVFFVGTASAHAKVTQSDPAMNSTIATAPSTITVTALEEINPDPKKSNLFVYAPSGDLISQGDATVPLSNPKTMAVKIKPGGDGVYIVRWVTVSADDGDPDEGAFVFTVKAGATGTTTQATPAQTTAPTTSSSSQSGSGTSILPALIAGIVALLIGLGAGFGLGRSRTTPATASAAASEQKKEDVPLGSDH